ncbi:FtsX-like permease family protein [Halalkalibacter sp. AB-rgal2]|uniref:FtsX-like permease family protein n=1 Tax=Halalkalibacter sp. AB-rgal2 TaxID=3242695 RepID=UPI00359DE55C
MCIHRISISDWKGAGDAFYELKERFQAGNSEMERDPLMSYLYYASEEDVMKPRSKIEEYHLNRKAGGLLFFVSSFLGALFFLATFMLLYLNVFSNIEQERQTFGKLYKIGITEKEVRKNIAKELRLLFFFAPINGLLVAYSYIVIFAKDGGGIKENTLLTTNFIIVALFYFTLQIVYYQLAKRKFMKELMGSL